MDKTKLLSRLNESVCELIMQEIEMKRIHDKNYMDSFHSIDRVGNILFFRNQPNIVIMKIFHILDNENKDNISFKNLIKDNEELVEKFNNVFCSEKQINDNKKTNKIFKYNYDSNINTIKQYRNKRGGHDSFNYSVEIEENKFVYADIYEIINKVEKFFEVVYYEMNKREKSIVFSVLRNDLQTKINKSIENVIRASELLKSDKEMKAIEFRKNLISSLNIKNR